MERIRSFVAITLPEELKLVLARLQTRLKSGRQTSVKWVDPNIIHLTLKFLGDIDLDKVNEITKALEAAVQGIPPFHLEVKELGSFPNLRRVQIIWVGLGGEVAQVGQLQQRIEAGLASLGFAPETRPFSPHLTLARLRDGAPLNERQDLGQLIARTKPDSSYSFSVDSIKLMRSDLTREGPIYRQLSSVALKKL